jgi:hypothetical protein
MFKLTILKNGCNPSCSTDFDPPTVESVDPVDGTKNFMVKIIICGSVLSGPVAARLFSI